MARLPGYPRRAIDQAMIALCRYHLCAALHLVCILLMVIFGRNVFFTVLPPIRRAGMVDDGARIVGQTLFGSVALGNIYEAARARTRHPHIHLLDTIVQSGWVPVS